MHSVDALNIYTYVQYIIKVLKDQLYRHNKKIKKQGIIE